MIIPVFKTGGRQVFLSPVGSTPTRFRHFQRLGHALPALVKASTASIKVGKTRKNGSNFVI